MQSRPQLKSFLEYINGSVLNEEYLHPNTSCLRFLVGASGAGSPPVEGKSATPGANPLQSNGNPRPPPPQAASFSPPSYLCRHLPSFLLMALSSLLKGLSSHALSTLPLCHIPSFHRCVCLILTVSPFHFVFSLFSSHSIPSSVFLQFNASL